MVSKQNKSRSAKMKAFWAKRRAEKEADLVPLKEKYKAMVEKPFYGPSLPELLKDSHPDMVNHPSHYTFSKYEVADVSDEWYANEPLLWNANKYMARWDKKGDPVENLEKAVWYLQRKIGRIKNAQGNS